MVATAPEDEVSRGRSVQSPTRGRIPARVAAALVGRPLRCGLQKEARGCPCPSLKATLSDGFGVWEESTQGLEGGHVLP